MRMAALALGLLIPTASFAEETPVLAEYWANSGSLPPEYAWSTEVTIRADGKLLLKHCKGYETEGPACTTRKARVEPAKLDAIVTTARASGLLESPALEAKDPPIGGGTVTGRVTLDGTAVNLPAVPIKADEERVADVLIAISQAIPPRLVNRYFDGD